MSFERDIAYWRRAADEATNKGAALVAFGIYAGATLAKEWTMTEAERGLLLTVGRLLRAHLQDHKRPMGLSTADMEQDLECLDEVLGPFDPDKSDPVNEETKSV
jgi:hypothetical protein